MSNAHRYIDRPSKIHESCLRYETITNWIKDVYPAQRLSLEKLKGDASFRHYYRLRAADKQYVVMDAPPEHQSISPFIHATSHLQKAGLRVPHIFHQNTILGTLILEDFGSEHYLESLNDSSADTLYQHAIDCIIKLQKYQPDQTLNRFNHNYIRSEIGLFTEWYLSAHCQITTFDASQINDYLTETCLEQPYVTIHRDFHSRNLMVLNDQQPGILDHQDLMYGPVSYDLVSLLRDCYIAWPTDRVTRWLSYFIEQQNLGLDADITQHWFDVTGVQRHLMAVGTFARLAHRYHNPSYLKYIPQTLAYVLPIARRIRPLRSLATLIEGQL